MTFFHNAHISQLCNDLLFTRGNSIGSVYILATCFENSVINVVMKIKAIAIQTINEQINFVVLFAKLFKSEKRIKDPCLPLSPKV